MMPRMPEPEYMDLAEEAEAYARADFAEVNQAFVDRLLDLVGPRSRAEALDLGTGPADIPIRLLRALRGRPGKGAVPAWHITAVDASDAMLRHAEAAVRKAGLAAEIRLVLADAKSTGLVAKAFDVVFSNSILHHISDAGAFWAELKRLAKEGALVFLRDLARPADQAAARAIVIRYAAGETPLLREEYYRSLLSAYTVKEVRRQLASTGLDMLRVELVTDRHLDVWGTVDKAT